jgi:type I restriction-modification system DNA methylase subunit
MATIYHDYLKKIHSTYMNPDATEPSYYFILKELLESLAKKSGMVTGITVQPKKTKSGIPDFLLKTKAGKIVGYVEAKDPMIDSLINEAQTEQLLRYRGSLPNLILTNFLEFYLFRNGKIINEVRLANPVFLKLGKQPVPENIDKFNELVDQFFSFSVPETYTAKALATELAKRTRFLSSLILEELNEKTDIILGIYKAFKEELIESLTEESFADMYAQTISYGLFSARIQAREEEFSGSTAYKYIPSTIPLLRHLFYLLTGPNLPESLEWIRDDIADVLASAELSSIIQEFHTKVWTDDPVLHFYETFLAVYNPGERKRCGVYYTPEPVVSYIIRSIHHILKDKFGKPDGLADKSVTLLDPAAGTLSFPSMAIRLAKDELESKGKGGIFPGIVKEHILPHFYAFELMVAPYAIGHLKAAIVLEDLGYRLSANERFQFYLTNSLEMKEVKQIELIPDLTKEGQKAKEIKEKIPILVVCANPPYSVSSENKSEFIEKLMDDYKEEVKHERNIQPLSDDYIKFIRFAQWKIEQAGKGVIGYITNNSYLPGLIHRGMRHKLLQAFNNIYVLNLHGSTRITESIPNGGKDENVFDIQQGVAIILLVKTTKEKGAECTLHYADIYGLRKAKYQYLLENDVATTDWRRLDLKEPYYFFVPKEFVEEKKYRDFWSITEIFKERSTGVKTHRDHFVVAFTQEELAQKLRIFTGNLSDELVREGLKLHDTGTWQLKEARRKVKEELKEKNAKDNIYSYAYRPFDNRWIYYSDLLIDRPRSKIMQHLALENLALVTTRQLANLPFAHCFPTSNIGDICLISLSTKESSYFFPLYFYLFPSQKDLSKGTAESESRQTNFKPEFVTAIQNMFGKEPSPEEIFYFIYGVLYSNIYRQKYEEFLQIDFPKIPFTSDYQLFQEISQLGKQLVELHLLKSSLLSQPEAKYPIIGTDKVGKWEYQEKMGRVFINSQQYFEGIPKEVWEYRIGGYQVLDKWLKDREGCSLSPDDVEHYLKVITAIKHTINLQHKIDEIYPSVEESLIPLSM